MSSPRLVSNQLIFVFVSPTSNYLTGVPQSKKVPQRMPHPRTGVFQD
jgi:hypothetical protein